MTRALWLLAAALPLAAQPKLLVNAKTDTRSAASGLESAFKAAVNAQPQPAWIGYSVPAVKSNTNNLGCDYVRDSNLTSGVVHLEPPDSAIVMFRVENNQVGRIRTISPYCEIDAGDTPVHWLNDVQPAQSVALLAGFAAEREAFASSAVNAIGHHADGSADQALQRFLAPTQTETMRRRAVSYLGSRPGGLDLLKKTIAGDPDSRVREAAVSSLANSRQPEALELLISIAKSDNDSRMRSQAVSGLGRKSGARIVSTLSGIVESDRDLNVRKRAISALQSMPDGEGLPVLLKMARAQGDPGVREQAVSSLANSRNPEAVEVLISIAKSDDDSRMRSQAVAGLGRQSGAKVVAALSGIVENDRDLSVRKRAISALHSMPDGEGLPVLIQLARTQRDLEVRKQAMSSLQNSRDPRVIAFLEEVIKK